MFDRVKRTVRGLAWIPLVLLAGLLVAPARVAAQSPKTGLIESGDAPTLMLLYTGDVIGHLGPCG